MGAPDSHTARAEAIDAFLAGAGWVEAERDPLPGDASTRRYIRLAQGGERAMLLVEGERVEGARGPKSDYARAARLADGDTLAVVAIAEQLTQRGFSAPRVLASDVEGGLVLLEDLGDRLLARELEANPTREPELYGRAADTLAAIYRSSFPRAMGLGAVWEVPDYDDAVLHTETELFLDWYRPTRDAGARAAWRAAWEASFAALAHNAPGLVLRDFHAENLFVLDDRDWEAATGVIDFQDALFGHPAYDLVSLLQDARRDVGADVEAQAIGRFLNRARLADTPEFRAAYHVLGAQRAAKILGIFTRLAERDGKKRYLDFMPRVEAQFARNLQHPALAPVAAWVEAWVEAHS